MLKLYTYFRSSAAYRVRIGLQLKGLAYESVPVHLARGGGEHLRDDYRAINPGALVPCLSDGTITISQSLAILEYLEERWPPRPLLPTDAAGRARVRALAMIVACDIHPLNNLRVLRYLTTELDASENSVNNWYRHWVEQGLGTVEAHLAREAQTGEFCHGDTPGLADCGLIPQVFNARRFNVDLTPYPTIRRISDRCAELPEFAAAHPGRQPDAE